MYDKYKTMFEGHTKHLQIVLGVLRVNKTTNVLHCLCRTAMLFTSTENFRLCSVALSLPIFVDPKRSHRAEAPIKVASVTLTPSSGSAFDVYVK